MDQPAAGTVNSNADEDADALAAVEQHHAGMLKRLDALTATLVRAVRTGDAVAEHDAHEVLVEWCEADLVPHALAEEGPLYSAPRELPPGEGEPASDAVHRRVPRAVPGARRRGPARTGGRNPRPSTRDGAWGHRLELPHD